MKILHVGSLFNLSYNLAAMQCRHGLDASIYLPESAWRSDGPSSPLWQGARRSSFVLTWKDGPLSLLERLRVMHSFDLVQTAAMSTAYGWLSGKPSVAYAMGGDLRVCPFQGGASNLLLREGFHHSRRIFVSGPYFNDALKRLGLGDRVEFVPQYLDLRAYAPRYPSAGGRRPLKLLYVSRADFAEKGSQHFAKALAQVRNKKNLLVRVIRTDEDFAAFEKFIRQSGVKYETLPLLNTLQLSRAFADADAVVDQLTYPYYLEGTYGLATLQAMASGKAVLTSLDPRPNDLKTGYADNYDSLPPLYNAQSFDGLVRLLDGIADSTPAILRRRGLAARRWVERNHSEEKIFRRFKAIYAEVLGSASR